jgi:ribulose 1,5-bisphosphate carboxylase large subunit-like protein
MRAAWDATISGESLADCAARVPAVAAALDAFGSPR